MSLSVQFPPHAVLIALLAKLNKFDPDTVTADELRDALNSALENL